MSFNFGCHNETGRQIRIDTDTAAPVIVVEFGPQLADCALHTHVGD
jgi:hypothetical protein